VFDVNGKFSRRLIGAGGALNSPWGLALAPAGFCNFGGDLLVGNFGDLRQWQRQRRHQHSFLHRRTG
jgi:hypothetical protein